MSNSTDFLVQRTFALLREDWTREGAEVADRLEKDFRVNEVWVSIGRDLGEQKLSEIIRAIVKMWSLSQSRRGFVPAAERLKAQNSQCDQSDGIC